ncbi:hypothetical protein LY76DRAFT_194403 [Colletotrichum caudatum]|nr:hypothetical protein LY76DRAFT_194403 [Colletotrichum caudatum]
MKESGQEGSKTTPKERKNRWNHVELLPLPVQVQQEIIGNTSATTSTTPRSINPPSPSTHPSTPLNRCSILHPAPSRKLSAHTDQPGSFSAERERENTSCSFSAAAAAAVLATHLESSTSSRPLFPPLASNLFADCLLLFPLRLAVHVRHCPASWRCSLHCQNFHSRNATWLTPSKPYIDHLSHSGANKSPSSILFVRFA